jgi:hypothetical protein
MTSMVNGGCTCSFRVGMTIQSCWGETPQGTNLGEKNQLGPLLFFFLCTFQPDFSLCSRVWWNCNIPDLEHFTNNKFAPTICITQIPMFGWRSALNKNSFSHPTRFSFTFRTSMKKSISNRNNKSYHLSKDTKIQLILLKARLLGFSNKNY